MRRIHQCQVRVRVMTVHSVAGARPGASIERGSGLRRQSRTHDRAPGDGEQPRSEGLWFAQSRDATKHAHPQLLHDVVGGVIAGKQSSDVPREWWMPPEHEGVADSPYYMVNGNLNGCRKPLAYTYLAGSICFLLVVPALVGIVLLCVSNIIMALVFFQGDAGLNAAKAPEAPAGATPAGSPASPSSGPTWPCIGLSAHVSPAGSGAHPRPAGPR